jgi:WD40 repeat protein
MRHIKIKKLKNVFSVHYHPDGQRLLVVGGYEVRSVDEAIWVDIADGKETSRITLGCDSYAVTSDLSKLAVGNPRDEYGESLARVAWRSLEEDDELHDIPLEIESGYIEVPSIAFSLDGTRLAASIFSSYRNNHRRRLFIASLAKMGRIIEAPDSTRTPLTELRFTPNAEQLVGCCVEEESSSQVLVVNSQTFEMLYHFTPKGTQTRQLTYSPDGSILAVVNGRNVYLLAADSGELRATLKDHPKQVNAVAFSPDGKRLMSACHDQLVRVWDVESSNLIHKYDWGLGAMLAISFAPDGMTAAAGSMKGQLIIWDID